MPNLVIHVPEQSDFVRLLPKIADLIQEGFGTGFYENGTYWDVKNDDLIFTPKVYTEKVREEPHSRACGIQMHSHGTGCSNNCPTCHGKAV